MSVAQDINVTHVNFVDFKRRYSLHREEILSAIDEVLSSGSYILGEAVEEAEKKLSSYLSTPFVLTVANGTDALILSLKALEVGIDDEVIVPVNSFIASAGAVVAVNATPVFCDVTDDFNMDVDQIEKHITSKTKAIMPVHLTGKPTNMQAIMHIAKKHHLFVIEDAAQSIGAKFDNQMTGTIGDMGCFSLHPLKNLHVYGDGGFIVVKNKDHYEKLKLLRNHGLKNREECVCFGLNSRLDSVQAKLVSIGLQYLDQWNAARRKNAAHYQKQLQGYVQCPKEDLRCFSVFHNFVILTKYRDELAAFLQRHGIDTRVHYRIPLHLQEAAKTLGCRAGDFPVAERLSREMLSLPIHSELDEERINYVTKNIRLFFEKNRV